MKGWKYQTLILLFLLTGFIILVTYVQHIQISDKIVHSDKLKEAQLTTVPPTTSVDYLIPADEDLNRMSDNTLMSIYWKYINMLQILCKDIIRVGSLKDGGKEICVDDPYVPKAPCLVYSFGINNQFDFDKDIIARFGCDVHCFDPSMNKSTGRMTDHMWFYQWGLGGANEVNAKGWKIKTLDTIRKELGHTERPIDLLKIDIEGDEWYVIPQMIASGTLDDIKQISMETHFASPHPNVAGNWGTNPQPRNEQLSALRQLHDAGYRIFMRERNMWSVYIFPGVRGYMTNVNEISLIKPPS